MDEVVLVVDIQTLFVLLHALLLLSHGRLHVESEPMSNCSE